MQSEEDEGCGRFIGPYPCCTIITGDAKELAPSMPDDSVDLIFTDPVYDRIEDYRWLAETAARVLKPENSLLVFCGLVHLPDVLASMDGNVQWKGLLCWNLKGPSNKRYGKVIDNGAWLLWFGGWPQNYTPLVWDSMPDNQRTFHWQKSPQLTARHIQDFSKDDSIVYDPFCGGGTVPAVCKMLGRHYLAFEIDPDVAERARERVRNTQPPLFVMQPEQQEMQL